MMTTMDMVDALDEKKVGEFLPQDFQIVKLLGRVGMQVRGAAIAQGLPVVCLQQYLLGAPD